MIVVFSKPPLFDEIKAAFPHADDPGVMFCWGDRICIPRPNAPDVSPWLRDHEFVHSQQQGNDPAGWWRWYIADKIFRFAEELPAHQAEYRSYCRLKPSGAEQRFAVHEIAKRLSSALYGNMIPYERARALIKNDRPVR